MMLSATRSASNALAIALLFAYLTTLISASPALLFPRRGRGGGGGGHSSGGGGGHESSGESSGESSDGSSGGSSGRGSGDDDTSTSGGTSGGGSSSGVGTTPSTTNWFLISGAGAYGYPGGVRGNTMCQHGSCRGQTNNGDGITCQTEGTWFPFSAANITAACSHFQYNSTNGQLQTYNQTVTSDLGLPLNDEQGKPMYVLWTAQFVQSQNANAQSCFTALNATMTNCQGKNPDTQGGLYTYTGDTATGDTAEYGVDPQTEWCNC